MPKKIRLGIIGDFDGRNSHLATNEAIEHCAAYLGFDCYMEWLPTISFDSGADGSSMSGFDAFWCAPGSPYKSAQGAMNAIRIAREGDYPFIGTCGGFQHFVLEFARDVLGIPELNHADFDPYAPNMFISALDCSLVGETRRIRIVDGTIASMIYETNGAEEKYNCSFGLNERFRQQMTSMGLVISGVDDSGQTRIIELPNKNFFLATLFQPQLSSTPEQPHKLILAFLKAVSSRSRA
jgi:CTP synthase (UTP-ammonia lyase)